MRVIFISLFIVLAGNLAAQHTNILVGNIGYPNEPSICLDPKNPANIVAGANLNNYYVSNDTGKTWSQHTLQSIYGVWGDPVIGVDTNSHFYFLHLSNPPNGNWIDRIVCQKSTDAGQSWSLGTYMGLNNGKNQDKHWIAVNRNTNELFVTWTEFDNYGSNQPQDKSRILFSKSVDGGETWSPFIPINQKDGDCIDSDNTTEGAVPCIGPNGEIYVSWAGPDGLVFDRSVDGGQTWLAEDIFVDAFPGGWDYEIPGLGRCNGLPVTACDLSNGPYHGDIYINWTDQRNGSNDTDVWLCKSTDGGASWSAPVRVNDDPPGKHQFLTWMAIDQTTGWLWFVFYDRRNHTNNQNTDVYMALSKDGGQSFLNFKVSESPFSPSPAQFFGDYNNVTAHRNIVRPIWTRMDGLQTNIWTALVDVNSLSPTRAIEQQEAALSVGAGYPNPSEQLFHLPFKVRRKTALSLFVLDAAGKIVHTEFTNKVYDYGKYVASIDFKQTQLPAGTYRLVLYAGSKLSAEKVVVFGQ